MSTLPTNRKSHCCGCTHATSNVKSKPEVDEALLERRDLHLGNYLANYLTPRVQVLAKVKSMIEEGSNVDVDNGTIQLPSLSVPRRIVQESDLDELCAELVILSEMIDTGKGRDERSVHIKDFNGTGKSFTVDYEDTLSHTTPAHFLHTYDKHVVSEEYLSTMFRIRSNGDQGLKNYLEYLEPSRSELFPPEPPAPIIPTRTFWSGESCISSAQGGETVVHPGKHSSAQWEGSSLDTLQGKYPEVDFSVFGDNAPGLKSVAVGGRTVFSVPNTHAVVLGTDGSLTFVESDNEAGSIIYEKVLDGGELGEAKD